MKKAIAKVTVRATVAARDNVRWLAATWTARDGKEWKLSDVLAKLAKDAKQKEIKRAA